MIERRTLLTGCLLLLGGAALAPAAESREALVPAGSNTGPLLIASVPESVTSTRSGDHEKGAGPSKKGFQPSTTALRP